jgi:hypothetical protein
MDDARRLQHAEHHRWIARSTLDRSLEVRVLSRVRSTLGAASTAPSAPPAIAAEPLPTS